MLPLLLLASAAAAPAEAPAWTVQVDPLTAALGFAHIQVERALAPQISLYAGPNLRLYDGLLDDVNGPWRAAGLEAGLRWYPWGEAPRGAWLLARGVAGWQWVTDEAEAPAPESKPGGYASALAGYTAILGDRWVLSGGLGGQHFFYQIGPYGPTGWSVAAHSAVGVAF